MNLGFRIVLHRSGRKGSLYTVKFDDRDCTEFDRLALQYAAEPEFQEASLRLRNMIDRTGIRRSGFREHKYPWPVTRVDLGRGLFRLYVWWNEQVILLGGGGMKDPRTKKASENPELYDALERMRYMSDRLREKLYVDKEMKIVNHGFIGDHYFPAQD